MVATQHQYLNRQSLAVERVQRMTTGFLRECINLSCLKCLKLQTWKDNRMREDEKLIFSFDNFGANEVKKLFFQAKFDEITQKAEEGTINTSSINTERRKR